MSKRKESITKCKECLKTFVSQINLKKHIKEVHEKVKDFECEICRQRFTSNSSFNNHLETVHKKRQFECKEYKLSLLLHDKTVHKRERNFKCEVCPKKFARTAQLKLHVKSVHDKIKDFECKTCFKKFSRKFILLSHISRIHEKMASTTNH